ncbi:hypothetical protein ACQF4J_09250 [Streptomyces sp. C1-1]|uniref:hypothetical protein n=1 Tax=Streptomyces sp. C1-1 TaxID=3231173 RepID=UPI003CFD9E4D
MELQLMARAVSVSGRKSSRPPRPGSRGSTRCQIARRPALSTISAYGPRRNGELGGAAGAEERYVELQLHTNSPWTGRTCATGGSAATWG